ncbi:hypothetical protein [Pedobacter sp. SYP-B3415]|uniref:hypothetical protein n=1 Tax=Pedobacter sp. SYP-B3415 TaxID=2496641 RepID=UPI001F0F7696|nr:hypothetical protein [Pedobacter sp. SYP-B3415]
MKAPVLICPWLPATGMAIFPFILLKQLKLKQCPDLINHERIHLRQQLELLVLPFYVLYLIHYLVNRLRGQPHQQAYRNIVFEREAFTMDKNLDYLSNRGFFAWIRFL